MITNFKLFEDRHTCNSDTYFTSTETKDIWEKFNSHIANLLHFKKNDELMYCLKEYVSRGYDIDYYRYFYPLLIKVAENYEAVKFLIENGADVNIKTKDNYSVLMNSIVQNDNWDVFDLLVENGADLNIKTNNNNWDVFDFESNSEKLENHVKNKYPEKYKNYLKNKQMKKFKI